MHLHNASARIFVPDGMPEADALRRITHLGIGAHPDDLEFMAFQGIAECHDSATKWFGGVTCANGSGGSKASTPGEDTQYMAVRRAEQNTAATLGRYGVMIQLDHPSSVIKTPGDPSLKNDLKEILAATRPATVYTHNPADSHDTHLGVMLAALQAMRELPAPLRPKTVTGCEVWRSLDWLPDARKVLMNVSGHDALATTINAAYVSQISRGKRYDLATLGRRSANATFLESHAADQGTQMIFGMDLTPLVADESIDLVEHVCGLIDEFKAEVKARLNRRLGVG
jgi:LmbE family N-acetylglucosaminyl deacetylase